MITTKQLLALALLMTAHSMYPIYRFGFDYKTYDEYVTRAWEELTKTTSQVKSPDKSGADLLRDQQDSALKALLQDLNKKGDPDLSRHFEYEICGQWKSKFNHNYEQSLITNDWNWLGEPLHLGIQE